MIKRLAMGLSLLGFILATSGCAPKVVEKIVVKKELVYQKPYKFTKVDTNGTYIDMGSYQLNKMCAPKMAELDSMYREIVKNYEWQMDEATRLKVRDDIRPKE